MCVCVCVFVFSSLDSLNIGIQDAVLAAKLPLSQQDQADFDQQIRTHIQEQGSNANDILSIYVYVSKCICMCSNSRVLFLSVLKKQHHSIRACQSRSPIV